MIKLIPSESSGLCESDGVIIIENGRNLFEILRKTCDQKGRSQPYIMSVNFMLL